MNETINTLQAEIDLLEEQLREKKVIVANMRRKRMYSKLKQKKDGRQQGGD